jgi:hypothetical protein
MDKLIRNSWHTYAENFIHLGGVQCISSEIPSGDMDAILPLMLSALDLLDALPSAEVQPGHPEHELHPNQLSRSDSAVRLKHNMHSHIHTVMSESCQDIYLSSDSSDADEEERRISKAPSSSLRARRAILHTRKVARESAFSQRSSNLLKMQALTIQPSAPDIPDLPKAILLERSKNWLIENKVIPRILRGIEISQGNLESQANLLRIMGALLTMRPESAAKAVVQFEGFGQEEAQSLRNVFIALRDGIDNVDIVNVCLVVLLGVFEMSSSLTSAFAQADEYVDAVLDVIWMHLTHQDIRSRALKLLRWVREIKPSLTPQIAARWHSRRQKCLGRPEEESPKQERRWSEASFFPSKRISGMSYWQKVHPAGTLWESTEEVNYSSAGSGSPLNRKLRKASTLTELERLQIEAQETTEELECRKEAMPDSEDLRDCMDEADLPGDVELLRSVIRVHHYVVSQGSISISEAVEPLYLHHWDREVVIVGLAGLLNPIDSMGNQIDMDARLMELAQHPDFATSCKQCMSNFREPDVFLPTLQLTCGILKAESAAEENEDPPIAPETDLDSIAEAVAIACEAALDVLRKALKSKSASWENLDTWHLLLEAIELALRRRLGPELFQDHDVPRKLEEVWKSLQSSEDEERMLLVKRKKGGTEFIIRTLRSGGDDQEESSEESSEENHEDSASEEMAIAKDVVADEESASAQDGNADEAAMI